METNNIKSLYLSSIIFTCMLQAFIGPQVGSVHFKYGVKTTIVRNLKKMQKKSLGNTSLWSTDD